MANIFMKIRGLSVFGLILESGNWFSNFFDPDWKGKTVLRALQFRMGRENILCAFSSILESETVFFAFGLVCEIGNDFSSVWAFGIRKRIRFFFDFSLKIWFAPGLNIQLWEFRIGNKRSNRTFLFFFVDSALRIWNQK
ncbi:hypothetical protein C1645_740587 [Glomus cerebriforme]|uniref:Uncharacterized protein n=1 Tax=Glomus cerebriforme TaxID=658196 RepID=A0A397SL72_9GLOM|nr:hypothetical protein C1645_740587 [Glomus cerebriforme]